MSTKYNSNYDLTVPMSDESAQFNLTTGGGVDSYTVPGDATKRYAVRFSYNQSANVFVGFNVTPTVPGASTVTTQRFVEFNPGMDGSQRYAKGGDVINLLTPDTNAYCSLSLREIE